ncbi:MAG: LacI family DNA-binding transcriptional regulator [Terriglobales bacterium]
MVTIRDVAKASGFSPTTVSLVLNEAPLSRYIPAETKTKIKKVAKELDYRPNVFARSLRGRRSDMVGVIVFDITDPYCTHILRGIEGKLNAASMAFMLTDAQNSRYRFQGSLELLMQRRIEGLILIANSMHTNPSVLDSIRKQRIPVVVIGREQSQVGSTVAVNNELGSYLALKHLYELGHRDIAFIRGPKAILDSLTRWKGIAKFAEEAGLTVRKNLVFELSGGPLSSRGGLEAVKHLRTQGMFTAILAFDDLTAMGVLRGLYEEGLEVPRDCSVIGFDDIDSASYYNPPLTTVRQPMTKIGEQGALMLLDAVREIRSDKNYKNSHVLIEPELVVRATTAPLS